MEYIPYYFTAFVLLSCALAMIAVWARRRLWVRAGALVMVAAFLSLEYMALVDLLSRPKPVAMESRSLDATEATVIAASMDEGNAIYLWLRFEETRQPRYYALPWAYESAVELQKAIKEANITGAEVQMILDFESSLEKRATPRFFTTPPVELPMKPMPDAFEYRHPSLSV